MLRSTESLSEDARGYGSRSQPSLNQSANTRRPSTVSTLSNENTYSGSISQESNLNTIEPIIAEITGRC